MEEINLRDHVLKFGLMLGLVQAIITLVAWLMGMEWLTSYWLSAVNLLIPIWIMARAGITWKKMNQGVLSFKNAFVLMLMVYAVGGIIILLFNITLFNAIDPDLPDKMQVAIEDKTIEMLEGMGADDEVIEQSLARIEKLDENYKPSAMIVAYFYLLILGAIIALIIGAIIKKKPAQVE